MDNGKINWFPGHMGKAMRKTAEDVKLCDGVIYVLDARAPFACINEKLGELFLNKPVIYCINKRDAISDASAAAIKAEFNRKGLDNELIDGRLKKDGERLKAAMERAVKERAERDKAKGLTRTFRFMVAGVPNTGKSTVINTLCGSARAETGDKAGITRANRWIRFGRTELLDTPGTMPPDLKNQTYAMHLAYIGAINDDVLNIEDVALSLLGELKEIAPKNLAKKYSLTEPLGEPLSIFDEICKKRGYLLKGGESDYGRAARAIIDDLRKQRIGKICFEERESGR